MTSLAVTGDAFVAPADTDDRSARHHDGAAKHRRSPSFYVLDEHPHPEGYSTMLGFWIYIMSDCLLFSVLFATYGVLGGNYAAGPSPKDLFDLPLVAVNTTMLLLSSITYGFAMLAMQDNRAGRTQMLARRHRLLRPLLHRHRALRIRRLHSPRRDAAAQRLPVVVLHPGRHARPARHHRPGLDGDADGAGRPARPDRGQPPPADVPLHVLALSRRRLDRRLHLRLSDGNAPMNSDAHAGHDAVTIWARCGSSTGTATATRCTARSTAT